MAKRNTQVIAFYLLNVLLFSRFLLCTGSKQAVIEGGMYVIDRSDDDRPEWINKGFFIKGNKYYFIGIERSRDLGMARDWARQNVYENIAASYQSSITSEIKLLEAEVLNESFRYVESFTKAASKNVDVQGAITKQVYWEKLERISGGRASHFYEVYMLVEISKEEYYRGLKTALNKEMQELRDSSIKSKKERLKLLKTIEEGLALH